LIGKEEKGRGCCGGEKRRFEKLLLFVVEVEERNIYYNHNEGLTNFLLLN